MKQTRDCFDVFMESMNEPTTRWENEDEECDEDAEYLAEQEEQDDFDNCPECSSKTMVLDRYPYCLHCNWDSLNDPEWEDQDERSFSEVYFADIETDENDDLLEDEE